MPARCERQWEIDALREGRLSAKDEDSLARHVRSCAICAGALARDERLRELARAMPIAEPNALVLERLRARIVTQVATRPARRPRLVVAAAVVAPLVVALSAWAVLRPFAAPAVVSVSAPPASPPRPESPPAASAAEEDDKGASALPDPKPVGSAGDPRHGDPSARGGARDGKRSTLAATPKNATVDASSGDDATDAYAAAVALFHRGDYASASLAFRAFTRAYPREPQVEDATYLDAVALARAGRTDAAGSAAEEHLTRFPQSFHRREASILIARAARDNGDCARARAVLGPWLGPTADREAEATLRACAPADTNDR